MGMGIGRRAKAGLGAVAIGAVLLVAGCGGSATTAADAGWNPPRPAEMPDEMWTEFVAMDPAGLSKEDASQYCQALSGIGSPEGAAEDVTAFYDYVTAYISPVCSDLPVATGAKGGLDRPAAKSDCGTKEEPVYFRLACEMDKKMGEALKPSETVNKDDSQPASDVQDEKEPE